MALALCLWYVGTRNNINIWDNSKLCQSLHDGTLERNDFSFEVGGKVFKWLWFLMDGTYPELARFVKAISEPLNNRKAFGRRQRRRT